MRKWDQNSCTCPDYQTNLVGTCKHIEGVLLHLKGRLGERWDELVTQSPPVTQIYMPGDLAAQLARVRELTAPLAEDEEAAPSPSVETGEMLIAAVQDVIDLGRQLAAGARL